MDDNHGMETSSAACTQSCCASVPLSRLVDPHFLQGLPCQRHLSNHQRASNSNERMEPPLPAARALLGIAEVEASTRLSPFPVRRVSGLRLEKGGAFVPWILSVARFIDLSCEIDPLMRATLAWPILQPPPTSHGLRPTGDILFIQRQPASARWMSTQARQRPAHGMCVKPSSGDA